MTECPSCNYRNPSHVSTCMTCGRSLKTVRNNPGAAAVYPVAANLQAGIHRSKMAVFDIDDTLFDTSQRETNAKRAGLAPATPYTGDRKPSEYPKGKKAFMDFFNSPKQFRIDPIFPGALDHVRTLVRDGYTIAYLTGRPHAYFNATMEHLKEKGFPVFNDGNGQPLLFMKPNKKKKTAEFKYDVVRGLQGKFDVHYFYDDLKENRDMAFKLGVIGVYDLRDRLDVRNNPLVPGVGRVPFTSQQLQNIQQQVNLTGVTTEDVDEMSEQEMRQILMMAAAAANPLVPGMGRVPFTSQQMRHVQQQANVEGATSQDVDEMSEQEMRQILMIAAAAANPHGGGHPTQLERFLQDLEEEKESSKMGGRVQDYGRGGEHYKWRGNPPNDELQRTIDLIKGLIESREMRLSQADKMLRAYGPNEELEAKYWAIDRDRRDLKELQLHFFNAKDDPVETARLKQKLDEIMARRNPGAPAGYREAAGCIVQRGSDKKILLLRRSIHETSFHGMYELPGGKLEEGETPKEAALIETKEEAGLDVRIVQTLQPHIDHDMKKVYHGFVGAPKKGAKVKISEEHDEYKWVSIKQALALPSKKLSHHARFLLGAMQAEESIKGTKIVKQPGPDGKNCGNCAHYCSKTNTCHLWSKKKGSKVFVLPDWFCQGYAAMPLPNPLPKPRKKNGRKEPSKKFVDRMMGNTKMRAEFPDAGQRYAVTLRLVEKHYGKAARKKIAPRDNGLFGPKKHDYQFSDSFGVEASYNKKGKPMIQRTNNWPIKPQSVVTEHTFSIQYPKGAQPDWVEFSSTSARYMKERHPGPISSINFSDGQLRVTHSRRTVNDDIRDMMAAEDPAAYYDSMKAREEAELNQVLAEKGFKFNPSDILPIYSGEPKGMTKNLGAIFSEVVIGRNIVKDVGEAVQSIYRGLIGGRTSMAEKRLAMGVASMQKELSDNARKLGGNAVANVKMDYEVIQGTATISIVASADAIKMKSPPKKNPAPSKKLKRAKDKYKKFHGGKEPVSVKSETIDVGDVWYALGPCWSIGYMSPKETGDDEQKYIHHTNEDSKDGNFPMMYATMPENGEPMIVIKGGSMKIGMRDGLAWLID